MGRRDRVCREGRMIFIIGYLACCFALAALLLAMMGAVA